MLTDSGGIRRVAARLLAAMCTALAGCTSHPPKPIEVNDSHASVVSARVVWRPGEPEPGRVRHGISIDYVRHRGSGTQSISGGEQIRFPDATVLGPQTFQHEVEVRYAHVAYNALIPTNWFGSANHRGELEWLLGFGGTRLTLTSQGSAPAAPPVNSRLRFGGPVFGINPRWWLSEHFAAEAQFSFMTDLFDDRTTIEVAVAWRPVKHLSLRAGYTATSTNFGLSNDYMSNVDTTLRGPFLGLALDF